MKKGFLNLLPVLFISLGCQKSEPQKSFPENVRSNGHEQGNGTDNVPWGFGAAWLVGEEKVITYCFEASSQFGMQDAKIIEELEKGFRIWKNYLNSKNINAELIADYERFAEEGQWPSDKSKLFTLPLESRRKAHCDGSETVKFYFGVEDELIRNLKKNYFNPTAFSHRTNYDSDLGIGHGVIWINQQGGLDEGKGHYPDWSLPNRLLGILLHELGHVYGIGHLDGTIMMSDMFGLMLGANWTTEDQAQIEYKLSHIDHVREVFLPNFEKNKRTYFGKMAFNLLRENEAVQNEIAENFEFMVGRKPVGEVLSQFTGQKLLLNDNLQEFEFKFSLDTEHASSARDTIFKVQRTWETSGGIALAGRTVGLDHRMILTTVGEAETKTGIKVTVLIEQNLGTPLRISFIKDGRQRAFLEMPTFMETITQLDFGNIKSSKD